MNRNEPAQPVMAINPYSNKMMNVEPLFDFMATFRYMTSEKIDGVIRTFVTTSWITEDRTMVGEPFLDLADMFQFLYHIKDMFNRLDECEISIPAQKGGSK